MPTKTMFQLAPVQLPHSLLREIHCCCGPESTLPSMRVSDIQPPLAQPPFWWSTMLPSTCMRRKGTAWETAHCMRRRCAGRSDREALGGAPEGAGGVVFGQAGVGVDVAGDVHSVGRGAEAEHLGVEADRHVDVVFAGQEKERIARGAELAVLLDGVDLVDLGLDGGRWHGWIEDEDIGAEVGGGCGGEGGDRETSEQKKSERD